MPKNNLDAECERRARKIVWTPDCFCGEGRTCLAHKDMFMDIAAALKQMEQDTRKECAEIARKCNMNVGGGEAEFIGAAKAQKVIAAAIERGGERRAIEKYGYAII